MIKFTDDEFLNKFAEDGNCSRIGPTERMLYYLGLAILASLDKIIKAIGEKK